MKREEKKIKAKQVCVRKRYTKWSNNIMKNKRIIRK